MNYGYTRTYINYGWQDFHEYYTLTCCKCGSNTQRTATDGCNKTADKDYIKNLKEKLAKRAEEYSQQTDFVCNKCLKDSCKLDINFDYQYIVDDYDDLLEPFMEYKESVKNLRALANDFNKRYNNLIVKYKNELWVISDLYFHEYVDKLNFTLYRLNKRSPWLVTDTKEYDISIDEIEFSSVYLKDIQPKV